jgi:Spy/CpxP family protein refolding chaperone
MIACSAVALATCRATPHPPPLSPPPCLLGAQVNEGMVRAIERDVELREAARQPTSAQLRALMMRRQLQHALPDVERSSRLRALEARIAADPYDVEAQRELEEAIAQRNIEDNRELAMEVRAGRRWGGVLYAAVCACRACHASPCRGAQHMPEAFSR